MSPIQMSARCSAPIHAGACTRTVRCTTGEPVEKSGCTVSPMPPPGALMVRKGPPLMVTLLALSAAVIWASVTWEGSSVPICK